MPYLWIPPEPTKGRLMVADGTSWNPLDVGSDDQVLTADSAQSLGMKWAASGGGGGPLTAKVTRSSSTQSIAHNTDTEVSWDTEVWDTDGMVDLGSDATAVTIQTAGKYRLTCGVAFDSNSSGIRQVRLRADSTVVAQHRSDSASSGATIVTVTCEVDLAVNDVVDVRVYQNSGSSLNIGFGTGDQLFLAVSSL